MHKKAVSGLLCLALLLTLPVSAWAQELAVGGQALGIRLQTQGVLVSELSRLNGEEGPSPAEEAGVEAGDCILEANGVALENAEALISIVAGSDGEPVELRLLRAGEELHLRVQPRRTPEGQWMLGMLLRDGIAGIGTLTFCDPETGVFGALGHGISEEQGEEPLAFSEGSVTGAEIVGVCRGSAGSPGELEGCADEGRVLGWVEKNSSRGIYGHASAQLGGRIVETGEVSVGPATILSTVEGSEAEEFCVEITRVFRDSEGCHVSLSVTDPALRERTGGIVQGMSGSPILQDGKLVAAVTHVSVST